MHADMLDVIDLILTVNDGGIDRQMTLQNLFYFEMIKVRVIKLVEHIRCTLLHDC